MPYERSSAIPLMEMAYHYQKFTNEQYKYIKTRACSSIKCLVQLLILPCLYCLSPKRTRILQKKKFAYKLTRNSGNSLRWILFVGRLTLMLIKPEVRSATTANLLKDLHWPRLFQQLHDPEDVMLISNSSRWIEVSQEI